MLPPPVVCGYVGGGILKKSLFLLKEKGLSLGLKDPFS